MKYLETEYERKSFVISSLIMALLLLLCVFFGLNYMDPPPENGIAINFGTTDEGMGNDNPTETTMTAPQPSEATPESTPETEEEVVTQEVVEAIAIKETKVVKPAEKPVEKQVSKPKPVETPKPSKSVTDALAALNGPKTDGTTSQSDGTGNQAGNQGKIDGSIYSNSDYGSGPGTGTGNGSYGLAGRTLAKREKILQKCNEEGRVVILIRVNKNGEVIQATRAQGTTNSTKCLEEAAIATAKTFKWQPDSNAPDVQIGFIEINFRLGE
jgi:outer membrane biosynthesis protein TonB